MSLIAFILICADTKQVEAYEEVVIVIDPGHGGSGEEDESNSGAINDLIQEKDVNLITANALADYLEEYGNVAVYLTRTEDVKMTLQERVDYAKQLDADYLISVHYNASANHNFFGTEIYTSAFGQMYAKGHALSECIMNKWSESGEFEKDIKTRIGKNGADYYGLIRMGTAAEIPTIILEHGYLDNEHDFSHLQDSQAWVDKGRLDAQGIIDYLGLEKGIVKEKIEPTVQTATPAKAVMPDDTAPEDVRFDIIEYNPESGDFSYEVEASDNDSKLVYYGFSQGAADINTVFSDLKEWDSDRSIQKGVAHIEPGHKGAVSLRVYNSYELSTDVIFEDIGKAKVSNKDIMSTGNDGALGMDDDGAYGAGGDNDDAYSTGDDSTGSDDYEDIEDDSNDGNDPEVMSTNKTNDSNDSSKEDIEDEDPRTPEEKEEMRQRMKDAIDMTQTITESSRRKLVVALIVALLFGTFLVIFIVVSVIKYIKKIHDGDQHGDYSDRYFD